MLWFWSGNLTIEPAANSLDKLAHMLKNPRSLTPSHSNGSGFEEMVDLLSTNCGPMRASPMARHADFAWRVNGCSGQGISLTTCHFAAPFNLWPAVTPNDYLSVVLPRSGGVDCLLGSSTVQSRPGELLIAGSREVEQIALRGEPILLDVLRLDREVIAQAFASIFEIPLVGDLNLAPVLDLGTPCGNLIGSIAQTAIGGMLDNGPLLYSPIALSNLTSALADSLVRLVPHRYTHLLDTKHIVPTPRHVHHAAAFMRANIAKPITVSMVAHSVGVSVRALELGFRKFKNLTPATYLRSIRLQAAREELLSLETRGQSIREIGLKWGFFHFGRFSTVYRTAYGETPSETRKRLGGQG